MLWQIYSHIQGNAFILEYAEANICYKSSES